MRNSSKSKKPSKPRPDFPLYAHPLGYWSKKLDGRIRHFGRWGHTRKGEVVHDTPDGWREALELYKKTVDDLQAGNADDRPVVADPGERPSQLRIKDLANHYLTNKKRKLESGSLSPRTYRDCVNITDRLVAMFGKSRTVATLKPMDFANVKQKLEAEDIGPVRIGNIVNGFRQIFKFACDFELIDRPLNFGPDFRKPSKKQVKKHRNTQDRGERVFTPQQVKQLISEAKSPQLKAAILLAVNCGLGNTDVASLERSRIDFEARELNYPRPKTACDRRAVLWPETVQAVKEAIANRPEAKDPTDEDRIFLTRFGFPWVRVKASQTKDGRPRYTPIDALAQEFKKLTKELGIGGKGVSFYSLRHTYATVGRGAGDDESLKLTMGHSDNSMLNEHYTHSFPTERLRAVSEHVHQWLYSDEPAENEAPTLKLFRA